MIGICSKNTQEYSNNNIVDLEYIKNKKILNKYHIIYDNMLYILLRKYKNVYIVTDKIAGYKLLKKYGKIISRFYVEVFSVEQYYTSKEIGFKNVMLNANKYKLLLSILYNKNISIESITIGPEMFYSHKQVLIKLFQKKTKIYVYLVNNILEIKSGFCKFVNGFYID